MLYKSEIIQETIITSSNHFTGSLSTKCTGFHLLIITRTRLSKPYSLYSYSQFSSEGWRLKFIRLGQRVTTNLTLWHFGYGKGILTLPYDEQATTQGMAVSNKWVSYFQKCLFTLTNAHNPNQYKWGQQSLDITLGTIAFWDFDFP